MNSRIILTSFAGVIMFALDGIPVAARAAEPELHASISERIWEIEVSTLLKLYEKVNTSLEETRYETERLRDGLEQLKIEGADEKRIKAAWERDWPGLEKLSKQLTLLERQASRLRDRLRDYDERVKAEAKARADREAEVKAKRNAGS